MRKPVAARVALAALLGTIALPAARTAAADVVVISAAASLKNAFAEIGALSARSAGAPRPAFNFGASGDLVAQINAGAPVDVFASASTQDMDALEAAGRLLPGTRVDFAANEVVLIVPSTASAAVSAFADLTKSAIARIAMVNPKTGPAGRYAEMVFSNAGIAEAVRPKLVLAENVRQVLDYVARAEVDAGMVYATDAAIRAKEVTVAAVAPPGSHQPVTYPIAVLRAAAHVAAARAFVAAVRSDAGRAILARYGFMTVPAAQ
jgi:molybdate transport system substrate-binding protein